MGALWLVSQQFPWLIFIQMVSGTSWAAYELAFFLLFFESIAEEERTSVLTIYNLLNTTAWVAGSLIGGALLLSFDASYRRFSYFRTFVSRTLCGTAIAGACASTRRRFR